MFTVAERMFNDAKYTFTDGKRTFSNGEHKIHQDKSDSHCGTFLFSTG